MLPAAPRRLRSPLLGEQDRITLGQVALHPLSLGLGKCLVEDDRLGDVPHESPGPVSPPPTHDAGPDWVGADDPGDRGASWGEPEPGGWTGGDSGGGDWGGGGGGGDWGGGGDSGGGDWGGGDSSGGSW